MNNQQKKALIEKAEKAVRDCYHNATPNWPCIEDEQEAVMMQQEWDDFCEMAIEDINSGNDDYWRDLVEMFGKVYTWGRGGRTCVPEGLVKQRGGGLFTMNLDWHEGQSFETVVKGIQLIEKWNKFVEDCNKGCADWWKQERVELGL